MEGCNLAPFNRSFQNIFAVQECSATLVIQWEDQEAFVMDPVVDLMKPEMGVRGGVGQGSLISIY